MGKFAGLIALAFIASVCFFFLSYSISNFIIDRISDARIEESIVSELETYVEENRLRPESRKELWRWCRKGEVDIEVFVDGHLVFSSIFDVNNKQYNMEESEREKEKARSSRSTSTTRKKKSTTRKAVEKTINTTATTIGRSLGKSIVRSILGSIFKK